MDCKKAYSIMHDFLDGTMSPDEEKAFDRHLAGCPACARELRAYRSLNTLLDGMELEDAPRGFAEPVIGFLKATGRIREPVTAGGVGQIWTAVFGWVPARLRVSAVATALLLVVLSVVSITSGRFQDFAGKSTVAATKAYIDVQRTMSSVEILDGISQGLQRDVRTAKTIAGAVYLLLAVAGQPYVIPALAAVLMITIGVWWYAKTIHKRRTQNASYCF
jgi:anti-sigma factor RsiW